MAERTLIVRMIGDDRSLVVPAWAAIHALALNRWVTVERSSSEMRIRLGERALALQQKP